MAETTFGTPAEAREKGMIEVTEELPVTEIPWLEKQLKSVLDGGRDGMITKHRTLKGLRYTVWGDKPDTHKEDPEEDG